MNTQLTTEDLAKRWNLTVSVARGFLTFCLEGEMAEKRGVRRMPGQTGRGSIVYELDNNVLTFFDRIFNVPV